MSFQLCSISIKRVIPRHSDKFFFSFSPTHTHYVSRITQAVLHNGSHVRVQHSEDYSGKINKAGESLLVIY